METAFRHKDILLLHANGQSSFDSGEILAYGSLENLIASDTLAGIPNREKSLTQLWEAAQKKLARKAALQERASQEEQPQAEE